MAESSLDRGDLSLYRQVETLLREQIADGELKPGDRLPAEAELRVHYGVSRVTVRQALDALERDGLVERHVGRGTFVQTTAVPPDAAPRKIRSWRDTAALADQSGRLLRTGAAPAPREVASLLRVKPEAPVPFMIKVIDASPLSGVKRYVHPGYADHIDRLAAAPSFAPALSALAGEKLRIGKGWVEAILAAPRFAMMLKTPPGAPLLSVWWVDAAGERNLAVTQLLQPGASNAVGFEGFGET